jgi:hypothetical protein
MNSRGHRNLSLAEPPRQAPGPRAPGMSRAHAVAGDPGSLAGDLIRAVPVVATRPWVV